MSRDRNTLKMTKIAACSAAIISVVFSLAGCGTPQQGESRFKSTEIDTPIKVALGDREEGGKIAAVFARAAQPIIPGSFEYCLGDASQCSSASSNRKKLVVAKSTPSDTSSATSAFYKIDANLDIQNTYRINFYAVDAASKKTISTSIRFKPLKQPELNPNIERFTYEADEIKKSNRKLSGIEFDYKYGAAALNATAPSVRMTITNETLLQLGDNLGVVLAATPMNNTSELLLSNTAVTNDGKGTITIIGENFKPETLYKLRVHFYERLDKTQISGLRYLGSSSRAYHFVTDAQNNPIASTRAKITMRGLAEAEDWDLGRYDTSKGYTNDPGYGWCHMFYDWTIKPYLKTTPGNTHTHYNSGYWSMFGAQISAADIISISEQESIHGSFFRTGSHAAMLLSYDVATKQFVTLEGNFNNRVVIMRRSPGEISWVGHIKSAMIRD